ncbi:MAG: sodium:solute symporter family protein [Alphaproteobacteria bacterium]|nr:sodium:solute symporter family protein [Alphaproteobacteria bacterium]
MSVIEQAIIVFFLLFIICEGFFGFKKIENINVFAVGRRSFSTLSLWGTITATWISGSMFFINLQRVYFDGLKYYLPSFGMIISLIFVAFFISPRVKRFLGKTSVAEVMRQEYGEHVGSLTALAGFIGISGIIAIQFKVFGQIGILFFASNDQDYFASAVIIISTIIILYTAAGGIQSVVKTDIIQLICFMIALPLVGISFYIAFQNSTVDITSVEKFNIKKFILAKDFEWLPMIYLALYFTLPSLSASDFQRLTMGLSTKQSKNAYLLTATALFFIKIILVSFPIALYAINSNLPKNDLLAYIMNHLTFIPFFKVILALGIIAMAMSTADSYLNIGAVLIANDFYFFKNTSDERKLTNARICTFILGATAITLAILKEDLLSIVLFSNSFYMPIVTPILLALLFNFKTTQRCTLFTMLVSFLGIVIYKTVIDLDYNIIPPAMLLNIIVLFSTHYIVEKWELLKCFGIRSKLKN